MEEIKVINEEIDVFVFICGCGVCSCLCCCYEINGVFVYNGIWDYVFVILLDVLICYLFNVWYGCSICLEINVWFFIVVFELF